MTQSFIEDLIIGRDIQQIYRMGCDWTTEGKLHLHQGHHVLVNFLSVNTNKPNLHTLCNVQIPA